MALFLGWFFGSLMGLVVGAALAAPSPNRARMITQGAMRPLTSYDLCDEWRALLEGNREIILVTPTEFRWASAWWAGQLGGRPVVFIE